jgi:hypothetical protein
MATPVRVDALNWRSKLPPMLPPRFSLVRALRRAVGPLSTGLLIIGCKQDAPVVRVNTKAATSSTHVDSAVAAPASNGWNPVAGPVLLVAGASPDEAIVFFGPSGGSAASVDTGSVDQATATLFGRDSSRFTGTLELPAGNDNAECRIWPLRNLHAIAGAGTWSVGFLSSNVTVIPLDSVDELSARDSMALAAEASRLASSVTANTSPSFQGLRFTAQNIRRFEAAPGVQALAAQLIRRVNQEADPQEEQTLVIAERDSGVTTGRYQLAYAERSFGKEDDVVSSELVGAVRVGPNRTPSLVIARDSDAGLAYALIERTGPRQWVARWTSSLAKCAD